MPEDTNHVVEWSLPDHEPMRRMILSRFEDDVLLRQEVEAWLDAVTAPGEPVLCGCPALGMCYCSCKRCARCDTLGQRVPARARKKGNRKGRDRR